MSAVEARALLDAMEKQNMGRIAAVIRDALADAEAERDEWKAHARAWRVVAGRMADTADRALAEVERLQGENG